MTCQKNLNDVWLKLLKLQTFQSNFKALPPPSSGYFN